TKHNFGFDWSKTCELISGCYNLIKSAHTGVLPGAENEEKEEKKRGCPAARPPPPTPYPYTTLKNALSPAK
ncbi:MAG TPA: hypothetical protein O0Y08_05050, partial [Methanocorpusculum sp.]|nr:hypothetical protein [Methanocorpusculum sp.]